MNQSHHRILDHRAAATLIVLAIVIAVQLPSCNESFWIDELHSAWCVWGPIENVTTRATIGHQSPVYYWALWAWKQMVGPTELALRASSVLMMASSCAIIAWYITNQTQQPLVGTCVALTMALDPNTIFFGTELRPYASVVLCATVAVVSFLVLIRTESRREKPGWWFGFLLAILLAFVFQPTSIGVLSWLMVALAGRWFISNPRDTLRITLTDVAFGSIVVLTIVGLWISTLSESWDQRSIWRSFATATETRQLWFAWNWIWLWIAPMSIAICAWCIPPMRSKESARNASSAVIILGAIALFATVTYWVVSYLNWVPLWHRRYFVAVLPILGFLPGLALLALHPVHHGTGISAAFAVLLLVGSTYHTGTLGRLLDYPQPLVSRGEGWREAVNWVNRRLQPGDTVILDSGLIEAYAWLQPHDQPNASSNLPPSEPSSPPRNEPRPGDRLSDDQEAFLRFPLRGPYQVGNPITLADPFNGRLRKLYRENDQTLAEENGLAQNVYVIARMPTHLARTRWNQATLARSIESNAGTQENASAAPAPDALRSWDAGKESSMQSDVTCEYAGFGNITVVHLAMDPKP